MSLFTTEKYSDREAATSDYLGSTDFDLKVINACSPDEETDEHQKDDRAIVWKRLRPSAFCTIGKSICHICSERATSAV